MRKFTHFEKTVINKLISFDTGNIIPIQKFLENIFFTKKTARSLIIQLEDNYAMYFLPVNYFNNSVKQSKEINELIELFSLINYLNNNGYITIFKEGHHLNQKIYYVGEEFENPTIENSRLILNSDGVYSVKPEEVKNKNGEVIYKGIEFKNSDLILKNAIGKIFISKKILEIFNKSKTRKKGKSFLKKSIFKIIGIVLAKLILVALFYTYKKVTETHNSNLTIYKKLNKLDNKLVDKWEKYEFKKIKTQQKRKYGIDISRWNGNLLDSILPDNLSFVICKATEGSTWVDPLFESNSKKIKNQGLMIGAYHFYIMNDDPIKQAEHFWGTIKKIDSLDIEPIIDIERGSIKQNIKIDPITLQAGVLTFLNHLEKLSSKKPMIYVNTSFANKYITHKKFAQYPLWLANYTSNSEPQLPKVWEDIGYKIWQKTNSYEIVSQTNDLDIMITK